MGQPQLNIGPALRVCWDTRDKNKPSPDWLSRKNILIFGNHSIRTPSLREVVTIYIQMYQYIIYIYDVISDCIFTVNDIVDPKKRQTYKKEYGDY